MHAVQSLSPERISALKDEYQARLEKEDPQARWDLSFLYAKGLEDPEFKEDFEQIQALNLQLIKGAQDLEAKLKSKPELLELLSKLNLIQEEFSKRYQRCAAYVYLSYEAETTNTQIASWISRIEAEIAKQASFKVAFASAVSQFSLDELMGREELRAYRHLLFRLQEESKHQMSAELEELAAYMNICGAEAWAKLHSQLTSTLKVPYKDEIKGLDIRDLAYSPDPEVRKSAYEAEYAAYAQIEQPIAAALHSIKKQVKYLSEQRNFESPLAQSVFNEGMQQATLDALIEAMSQNLGLFHRYLQAKARLLGQEGALAFWDLFAPVPQDESRYDTKECHDTLVEAFAELHAPLAEMIHRSFTERWIDFYPREAKVGGAFCYNLPDFKRSVVLHNYDSSTNALLTTAHELGHAYHGECLIGHKPLNYEYAMTLAETASTFNETHLVFWLIKHAKNPLERLSALETFLQGSCQTVCDIYSRFLFEREVFERCDKEVLSPDDMRDIMKRAQIQAYGAGLDESSLHDNMWIPKGHYYSSYSSFYNYPYAFGSLLAMGIYNRILNSQLSMEHYDEFLRASTVSTVEEAGAVLGIDLSSVDFWVESLKAFEPFVLEYEDLVAQIS